MTEPCKTCGGTGYIEAHVRGDGRRIKSGWRRVPCPSCGKPARDRMGRDIQAAIAQFSETVSEEGK